jgi:hypothetical protein
MGGRSRREATRGRAQRGPNDNGHCKGGPGEAFRNLRGGSGGGALDAGETIVSSGGGGGRRRRRCEARMLKSPGLGGAGTKPAQFIARSLSSLCIRRRGEGAPRYGRPGSFWPWEGAGGPGRRQWHGPGNKNAIGPLNFYGKGRRWPVPTNKCDPAPVRVPSGSH